MKAYPTVATHPNRKMRKSMRKKVFEENQGEMKRLRASRKEARKAAV